MRTHEIWAGSTRRRTMVTTNTIAKDKLTCSKTTPVVSKNSQHDGTEFDVHSSVLVTR